MTQKNKTKAKTPAKAPVPIKGKPAAKASATANGRPVHTTLLKAGKEVQTAPPIRGLESRRQEIYDKLPAEARSFCDRMKQLVDQTDAHQILQQHALGCEVLSVSNTRRYGNSEIKKMAVVVFGSSSGYSALCAARRVAEVWNISDLRRLIATATKNGHKITSAHLKYLVALDGPHEAKRLKLEQEVVTNGMKVSELAKKVRKRTTARPAKDPIAGLTRFNNSVQSMLAAKDDLVAHIFAPLSSLSEVSEAAVVAAQNAVTLLEKQRTFVDETIESLQAVIARGPQDPEQDEPAEVDETEEVGEDEESVEEDTGEDEEYDPGESEAEDFDDSDSEDVEESDESDDQEFGDEEAEVEFPAALGEDSFDEVVDTDDDEDAEDDEVAEDDEDDERSDR